MGKFLIKTMSMLAGVLAWVLAGAIFQRLWKIIAKGGPVPEATDVSRSWWEVLLAATLRGAITAGVRAAADRGAAEGAHKLTGGWPGDEGHPPGGAASLRAAGRLVRS
jgi:hypothetical protein